GTPITFTISGRVADGGSNGISGVTMSLSGSATDTKTTDANGNYSFTGLGCGGNYTVMPSKSGFSFTPPSQTFNTLTANQTADFTGTPITFTISGQIRDNNSTPLSGVTLALSGSASGTT